MERLPPVEDLIRSYHDLQSFEKVGAKYAVSKFMVADVLRAAGVKPSDTRFRPTAPRIN